MHPQDWQRSVVVATNVFVGAVVVGAMYWAQAVLVPVALALLLMLVLTPPVQGLQRLGVGRVPAVVLVVALTSGFVVCLGWLMTRQFVQLAAELPAYSDTIKDKVRSVREMVSSPADGKFGKLIDEVSQEFKEPADAEENESESESSSSRDEAPAPGKEVKSSLAGALPRPAPIVVQSETPAWFGQLTSALGSVGETLATFALAVVLTIFMLLNRESLRDRVILLVGHARMTATTKAFDEAIHRISRFLMMQLVVNGTYGVALAVGLMLLGVRYALLWGLLAAVLRYIPYVGAWIAATPPVLISMAMTDGWAHPLMVIGWIVVLELLSNNVMEPLLYGHSIGISPVALLVAATFWAFLWGPIGLVLSSPLTVCLVVLGKFVPRLQFIDTLMGDQPALAPHVSFYQRLLARDQDEARHIALSQVRDMPAKEVFDRLVVPALSFFRRDQEQEELTEADRQFILRGMHEIVDELTEHAELPVPPDANAVTAASARRVRLLMCPADGKADEMGLEMLLHLMDKNRWDVQVMNDDVLSAELVDAVVDEHVHVVCIASIPPGALAHTRYLCKRLRSYHQDVHIVVGRWGATADAGAIDEQLRAAGADHVDHTLLETSQHLESWWSLLMERDAGSRGESDAAIEPRAATRAK